MHEREGSLLLQFSYGSSISGTAGLSRLWADSNHTRFNFLADVLLFHPLFQTFYFSLLRLLPSRLTLSLPLINLINLHWWPHQVYSSSTSPVMFYEAGGRSDKAQSFLTSQALSSQEFVLDCGLWSYPLCVLILTLLPIRWYWVDYLTSLFVSLSVKIQTTVVFNLWVIVRIK